MRYSKSDRYAAACVTLLMLAVSAAAPRAVSAQSTQDDILRELRELRSEIQRLRAEVDMLKASPGAETTPTPQLEILQTQVAELAQVKVESTTRLPVKLFGTVHAGVFANSGTANWLDNPNLVGPIPADGHAGTMSASLRQTRLGFAADGPALGSVRTNAVVAMDFFGGIPGFQTGQVVGLPRLLVAFTRFEGERTAAEVGQDHMILAPRDPTSLAALSFPLLFRSGNLYLRVPQARVERSFTPHLRTSVGIVAPIGGDLVGDAYLFVPPALAGERSRRPGLQGRIAYKAGDPDVSRAIDVGLSGHVGWERQGDALSRSWATALDFGARRNAFGVAGEMFVGDNVDAFGGGLGLNARAAGGWSELQLFPSERLSLTGGFGIDDIRGGQRLTLPRARNRSAYGNAIFSLTPEVQASFEYRWLSTLAGSVERRNHHFDWVLVHKF